ncbi:MAG TPA: hypothetical protein VLM85_05815 [Polyangiaceae bacterium]|nr:hypothetical protein [Polyangiaceae bacterium]
MGLQPRILYSDESRTIAVLDTVIVLVATRPLAPEHVQMIADALAEVTSTHPSRGIGYVHVIDSRPGDSRKQSDETRRAFMDLARSAPAQTRGVGVALLAEGFVAAAMRGIISAAMSAFRTRIPMMVCGTVEETCQWLERMFYNANERVSGSELAHAIEGMRIALRRAPQTATG